MGHRYLNPHWWVLRLSPFLTRYLPSPSVMSLIGYTSAFSSEPEVTRLRDFFDGDGIVIDVGAAYGLYAWNLARFSKHCIAFEANPNTADELQKRLPHVKVIHCALSNHCGTSILRIPQGKKFSLTGLGTVEPENSLSDFEKFLEITVPTLTLDSFDLEDVKFIKIDVEGHELEVLKGAEKTLIRSRPNILVEVEDRHRENARSTVIDWLSERGYQMKEINLSPQNLLFVSKSEFYMC